MFWKWCSTLVELVDHLFLHSHLGTGGVDLVVIFASAIGWIWVRIAHIVLPSVGVLFQYQHS